MTLTVDGRCREAWYLQAAQHSKYAGTQPCCVLCCLQALLVRTIAGLRRNTAQRTDERVRLTGEVIQVRAGARVAHGASTLDDSAAMHSADS